jgi:hypothetical protein
VEGQVPVFISPKNRVTQLYPQAPGFLFVASSAQTKPRTQHFYYSGDVFTGPLHSNGRGADHIETPCMVAGVT